jgi:hypothetical protein
MGSKFSNRSERKPKKIKEHKSKYVGVLERQKYLEMAAYIEKNPFTESDTFKENFAQIYDLQEPTRQQYNQMEAWYNLSISKTGTPSRGKHLDDVI